MERWALVSGLRGDHDLYECIQHDLKSQKGIESLFVLGDLVGLERNCDSLLNRLRNPKRGDLKPDCIYGWWEEQLLIESGFRGDQQAKALRRKHGEEAADALKKAVDPDHLKWLASLQFGFIELDCGLIHGSSADIGDRLSPETSPLILLDRLTRLDVNRLFTARSGVQFRLELTGGSIQSHVKDHAGEQQQEQTVPKRSVIGIGEGANYTLYDPGSDQISFISVDSKPRTKRLGFG